MSFFVSVSSCALAFFSLKYLTSLELSQISLISGLLFAVVFGLTSNNKAHTNTQSSEGKNKKSKEKEKEKKKEKSENVKPQQPVKPASPSSQSQSQPKAQATVSAKESKKAANGAEKKETPKAESIKKAEQPAAKQPNKKAKEENKNTEQQNKTAQPIAAAPAPAPAPVAAKKSSAPVPAAQSHDDDDDDDDGWTVQRSDKSVANHKAKKAAEAAAAAAAQASAGSVVSSSSASESVSEVHVDPVHYPAIIGTKGANLQLLQSATGAKIDIPSRESNSKLIKISGSPEAVHRAAGAIDSLVRLGYSSITHPGQVHDDIHVDSKLIGAVVGPNGSHLKAIQQKTGTRINIPQRDAKNNERVVIVGVKENVKIAKRAIKDILADGFSPLTHEGWTKAEVDFPMDKIARLIGPKGQTIKSIQGNTKTQIRIPRTGDLSQLVAVVGPIAGVNQAVKEINRLFEADRSAVSGDQEDDEDSGDAIPAWGEETAPVSEDSLW